MFTPNGAMIQYFHWYLPPDGSLWNEFSERAKDLVDAGITAAWLPPATKGASGGYDVGYGLYDLYDLGEFDQKGSVRTKYGTKNEYVSAVKAGKAAGIQLYADIVLNHVMGADKTEEAKATPYDPAQGAEVIGDMREVKVWTHFTFPGRGGKYSDMEWHWWNFDAVDYNDYDPDYQAIYVFEGKSFDSNPTSAMGAYDYLMGCDLDMGAEEVCAALNEWGVWFVTTTGVDGFRFDAVKHVSTEFLLSWLEYCRNEVGRDLFIVGEYWSETVEVLHEFIDTIGQDVHLFDVPLHYNFHQASRAGSDYDMRQIFDNTLVQQQPSLAVTLVDNHDSQPLQTLESVVEPWFKPLAYALILLRHGGYPCIFYADYYGAHYTDSGNDGKEYEIWLPSHQWLIDKFLSVRRTHAYGDQYDYFDHPNTIGWTRLGDSDHPGGMAAILTNGDRGSKWMNVGQPNRAYIDITEHVSDPVTTNGEGWGEFRCLAGSVSVWVPQS